MVVENGRMKPGADLVQKNCADTMSLASHKFDDRYRRGNSVGSNRSISESDASEALLFLLCKHDHLPLNLSDTWCMLMVILRGQGVPFGDRDFIATRRTTVDTGIWSCDAR